MPKLFAHVAAATLLILVTKGLAAPVWLRVVAVVIGAFCVHLIWERWFSNPFLYLGARPVSPDDPLLMEAKAKAKESMGRLRELFPAHRQDTVVRFRLSIPNGSDEFVWGDLLDLSGEQAKVFLRTPPTQEVAIKERTMTITADSIDDWQIELRDGSLLGGFTNQAMFRVYEREEGQLHPAFREQIARFRDRLDGTPFAGVTWQVRKGG